MKKAYRSFSIILTLALILAFMPVTAFATDATVWPNAAYTITDKNGEKIKLQYDYLDKKIVNFPKQGDVVKIFRDGNTSKTADETYVYNGKSFDGGNSSYELEYKVVGSNYSNASIDLRVYRQVRSYVLNDNLQFDITNKESVSRVRAPLKSFTYSPSRIRLYSEDIKVRTVDGDYLYKFALRTTKSSDGHSMQSECAIGDKAVVTLEDGTVETYDSSFTSNNGAYGIQFVNSKGQTLRVRAKENEMALVRGDNVVNLYIRNNPEITTRINVFVWTPDMGPFPGDYDESSDATNPGDYDESSDATDSGTGSSSGSYTDTPSVAGPISSAVKALNNAIKSLTVAKAKIISAKKINSKIKLNLKPLTKKQLKNISNIQVQYSTDKKFKRAETKTVFINKNKKTYTTKKLKKGTYYTRVRNMWKIGDKKYYSKWSPVKTVSFK